MPSTKRTLHSTSQYINYTAFRFCSYSFSAGIVNPNHYLSQDWSTSHLRLRYLFSVVSLHTQHITVIFLPDCTYDHAFCQFAQNWRENMEKRASWHPYSTSGTCFRWSDQIPDVNVDHDRITMFTCTIFCHSEWIQSKFRFWKFCLSALFCKMEVKLFSVNVRDFRFITCNR